MLTELAKKSNFLVFLIYFVIITAKTDGGDMNLINKAGQLIYFLTLNQWQKIDEEYRTHERFDTRALITCASIAIVLIMNKYFGKSDFINSFPAIRAFFRTLPLSGLYPKLYWAFFSITSYFLLPSLIIRFVYREKIKNYGFHLEKDKKVLLLYLLMFLVVIPLVYLVSHSESFLRKYPFYHQAGNSFIELFAWEGAYGLQFLALEFFFRGYILFTLGRYIGSFAIFFMTVPYVMIHFTKPMPETVGAIITGIALGTLAMRTRSIYGGVIIHSLVAWSMDLFSLWHKGALARLLGW